ncbi:hypothetical protein Acy02nite_89520 [Actinoplanes cyaneus]|uniref:Type II secretion system protein GspF domain-containing protein n=1 Tax=Actinoplanes cyaneus TaxID=52696 RepID=A0A919ITN3_9ACTN|nr:type II secretion system F family protein [Actinoplanes cyaneus]MCW2144315.1 type II secretion system protein F (GspF) [Actinoplanes cyaneus]GID71071.1 hypothetical protein Acy02nite_89520 [Actinoplanes cyaneus]
MPPLMFALLTGAAAAGLVLVVAGIVGTRQARSRPLRRLRHFAGTGLSTRQRRIRRITLAAAALMVVVVWLVTSIPVAGLIAGLAVWALPWMFSAGAEEQHAIAYLEAVEIWTRRLSDLVRTGLGLSQAILVSTRDAPPILANDLRLLEANLRAGVPIGTALDRLADRLADPTSDEVIVALSLHAADRGQRLADILDKIVESVAREISVRREVWASRADPRLTTKIMTCLGIAAFTMLIINPPYARPYSSLIGQCVMAGCTAAFVALLVWIRKLSTTAKAPRLLAGGDPA